jgi:hypothetical protein
MKLNKSVLKLVKMIWCLEQDVRTSTCRRRQEHYEKTVPAIVVQKDRSWSVGSSIANRLVSKSGRLVVPTTFNVSEVLCDAEYHELPSWVYVGRMEGRGRLAWAFRGV